MRRRLRLASDRVVYIRKTVLYSKLQWVEAVENDSFNSPIDLDFVQSLDRIKGSGTGSLCFYRVLRSLLLVQSYQASPIYLFLVPFSAP